MAIVTSLMFATTAGAAPIACAASGSFADLLATNADGGCYVGDKLFSDFFYLSTQSGGATVVDDDDFLYTTIDNAPSANGFQFAFPLTALPNTSNDIQIGWLVTTPAATIVSNHLAMAGVAVNNAVAVVTETYCKGGPVAGCSPANVAALNTFAFLGGGQLVDEATFAPVSQVGVIKNINVTAGAGGFAHISGITQTVDQVTLIPEPGTTALVGCAFMALGLLRRRSS